MNKHEKIKGLIFKHFHGYDEQETLIYEYINEAEATENKLQQVEIENITLKLYREKYIELQREVEFYLKYEDKIQNYPCKLLSKDYGFQDDLFDKVILIRRKLLKVGESQ